MRFNNPLNPETIQRFLDELWLNNDSVVLDVGCGRGELIKMLVQRFGCRAVGVDTDENELTHARSLTKDYQDDVSLYHKPFDRHDFDREKFDACFCLGSVHAFGEIGEAQDNVLLQLGKLTKPGGVIVLADGYWRKEPEEEYLLSTGIQRKELRFFDEIIESAGIQGFECVYSVRATRKDWDQFEGAFWMDAQRAVQADPGNPQLKETLRNRRKWRDSYLRWGRDTMGFTLVALVKVATRES